MVGLQVGQSHCSCRAVAVRQEGIAFWSSLDAVLSVGRAVHRAENIVEQRFGRQASVVRCKLGGDQGVSVWEITLNYL